ncbi:hypothetical protein EFK50_19690 [Nocardioides marmoriginsengisoli]|uniref:Magnesium transporter MgtE intracellular domain-containing protein n=1 Tax=Nocardioides marmoriginsengisoli TaxID=661483 RepID=A0A3N0CC42_9ACTN|nr:hypothetical protein [Nocardioides marmoriginsengisoli]RNL60543.1 hypothetical protein EFK50_19690 [Nocardioides marmoriginsengisoli]
MAVAKAPVQTISPQVGRIARLLRLDPGEIHGLDGVPDADLRILHDQISRTLFAEGQKRFARVAGLSKTIPGPLAGVLAEKFLPPVMAARVSENLDPAKARDLIGRVSIAYLAEIALALDPVRSRPVVQKLPPEPIGKVAQELFARREYAVMAEFVGTVTVDALVAALNVATPHDLLAVVPLLEWNDNLDKVIAELPERQVAEIATSLTAAELADLAMALDPSRMGRIVAAVPLDTAAGIAEELFSRSEYAGMARFVDVVTEPILHAALGVASAHDLLVIVPLLEWSDQIDRVVDTLPDAILDGLFAEIAGGGDWDAAKVAFERLSPTAQHRLFARFGRLSKPNQKKIRAAAEAGELGAAATALLADTPM